MRDLPTRSVGRRYAVGKCAAQVSLVLVFVLMALSGPAGAVEPFLREDCPAPRDMSRLFDIDVDPAGRMVAVGLAREYHVGGSPFYPVVLVADAPGGPWVALDPPDFGSYYHELKSVNFVPGTDGDFVAVGAYYPNDDLAYAYGMLLRYRRATQQWELHSFTAPGALFHFIQDAVFDPDDSGRLLIVGTRGVADSGGGCFHFTTMVVDYHLEAHTNSILPTTALGGLWSIVPLPNGNFLTVGIAAGECDYLPFPVVIEVEQGLEIVHPNPPPLTPGFWYSLSGVCRLQDGRVFLVGSESPYGGSNSRTLSYRYDPVARNYEFFKPLDPDSNPEHQNLFWDVLQIPDGRVLAAGRITYYYEGWRYASMIQSFDGQDWSLHPLPADFLTGANSQLWGLTALPSGQVYCAGFQRDFDTWDDRTLILRSDPPLAVTDPPDSSSGTRLWFVGRQPTRDPVGLGFHLERDGHARLAVFDAAGRRVRVLLDDTLSAGERTIQWDGADTSGQPVASGVYLVRLESPGGAAALKILRRR